MKTRYAVETPDQLRELSKFVRQGGGSVMPTACVWSANRNAHGGNSDMNGKIFVVFERDRDTRTAYVERVSSNSSITVAMLRYSAKHHCATNLRAVD